MEICLALNEQDFPCSERTGILAGGKRGCKDGGGGGQGGKQEPRYKRLCSVKKQAPEGAQGSGEEGMEVTENEG